MNVLLVSHAFEKGAQDFYTPNTPYSLGLGYLAAFLDREGHAVKVLWQDGMDFAQGHQEIIESLKNWKPDVLGLQMFTMNRVSSYRLIEDCTLKFPEIKIVVGGIHASAMPEQIVQKYPEIIAVIGEGEFVFAELLKNFSKGSPTLDDIKGLVFFRKGEIVRTKDRDLIEDLDSLPHPKHGIFFDEEPKRTMAHIVTTRGCPFMCSFCCLHIISRRKFRKRDIKDVVREIVELKQRYPRITHVQIHDDIFTLDNQRVIEFCKLIIKENLGLRFIASTRVKPVSEEMFVWMEKAGFEKIMFGLETGSAKLMKSMKKGIVLEDVVELFKMLRKFKFLITTFLIVGFPGETEETIQETIRFVNRLQKIAYNYIVGVGRLAVYPKTAVYAVMHECGDISDDFWLTDKPIPFFTSEHSNEELCRFENNVMDHVSVDRIFTWKGFRHHFMKMPGMIIYFFWQHPRVLKSLVAHNIKNRWPRFYEKLYKIVKG
jgi:radical SAM superfamily enzyme YgiQ (UPF0313 family)